MTLPFPEGFGVPEYPRLTELVAKSLAEGVPEPKIVRAVRRELKVMKFTPIQVAWGARFHLSRGIDLWRKRLGGNP